MTSGKATPVQAVNAGEAWDMEDGGTRLIGIELERSDGSKVHYMMSEYLAACLAERIVKTLHPST